MGHRNFVIGLAGLVAVCGLTCAPRHEEPPDTGQNNAKGNGGGTIEHVANLKELLRQTLKEIKDRPLQPQDGFWTIFHAILGMGLDTELVLHKKTDKTSEQRVKAIEYVFADKPMPGLAFFKTEHGLDVRSTGPQGGVMSFSQGHQDQFIAEMGQWGISAHTPVRLKEFKDLKFTFMDFCKHSKMRASVNKSDEKKQELSWAIIIIGQFFGEGDLYKKDDKGEIVYLPWTNAEGETLNYDDVVRYEVDEPIEGAACGGTHRLFGLTWAYHLHLRRGGKISGVWRDVADKINEHKRLAKACQNADGAFSTKWFEPGGLAKDINARVATTGHILEWLGLALTDKELQQEWVHRAVRAQCFMVLETKGGPLEGGGLYHATHGLNLFDARIYGGANDPRLHPVPLPPKD